MNLTLILLKCKKNHNCMHTYMGGNITTISGPSVTHQANGVRYTHTHSHTNIKLNRILAQCAWTHYVNAFTNQYTHFHFLLCCLPASEPGGLTGMHAGRQPICLSVGLSDAMSLCVYFMVLSESRVEPVSFLFYAYNLVPLLKSIAQHLGHYWCNAWCFTERYNICGRERETAEKIFASL